MSRFAVILPAAGQSTRFGDLFNKKVFTTVGGKPMWMHSAELFSKQQLVGKQFLVIAEEDRELFNDKFSASSAMLGIQPVIGGATRADSVRNALMAASDYEFVAIHDAARPCLDTGSVQRVFEAAIQFGAAVLALPCTSTVKRADKQGHILETVPRDDLWLAQTPQVFRTDWLLEAYETHPEPASATDDASLIQSLGHRVQLVEGSPLNIKVTTKADLRFVEAAIKSLPKPKAFPF